MGCIKIQAKTSQILNFKYCNIVVLVMSSNSTIFDHCNCPVSIDKYGRMERFHNAADELEVAVREFFGGKDADN